MKRVAAPLAAALLASAAIVVLAACGGSGAEPGASNEATPATLVLDFQPNAVHAGIYDVVKRGYTNLTVREPSASTDAPKLLEAGRAQFAVMDIHDLGIAAEKGFDVVGVAPIVQRPLASILASPDIARPRDLEGKTVGVTGLPSDDAVLDSIVSGDGGDPSQVKRVTIGFNAVSALAAGKVDAVTAFWNAEGVALKNKGVAIHEFRVDAYGAPRYPELVLATSSKLLKDDPDLVHKVAQVIGVGNLAVSRKPEHGLASLLAEVPGLDRAETKSELDALVAARALRPTGSGFDRPTLEVWARWDVEHEILSRPPDLDRLFDLNTSE